VTFRYELVESMPATLEEGVLYISQRFRTASHRCACGCGYRVVTPLRPGRWQVRLSDKGATLRPSIGNSSFRCRSHYYITCGRVEWLGVYTDEMIAHARARDNPRAHPKLLPVSPWWRRALRCVRKQMREFMRCYLS
jgi:hypothetical protein